MMFVRLRPPDDPHGGIGAARARTDQRHHRTSCATTDLRMNFSSSTPHELWLTVVDHVPPLIVRSRLLGLTSDRALLCTLPEGCDPELFTPGTTCKGRSIFEGETYQFETTIRQNLTSQPGILLDKPARIERHRSRSYPRLRVHISGTIRPLHEKEGILAVVPVIITNLCPTGCQLSVHTEAWPNVATPHVFLSCVLPGIAHRSKIPGSIEWIDPTPELRLGIQFSFSNEHDPAQQDLQRWFTSQQAQLIDTVI